MIRYNTTNKSLKYIEDNQIYLTKNFNMYKLSPDEWNKLSEQTFTYSILDNPLKKYIKYPGLIFSNNEVKNYYNNNYYKHHIDSKKEAGYPRGNLTDKNSTIIIGQRPGHTGEKNHLTDTSNWICGILTVELLMLLCYETNIYPYFTNYYKMFNDEQSKIENHYLIKKELNTLY